VDEMNKSVTLRGVLKLKVDKSKSIPLSEVRAAPAAAAIRTSFRPSA